MDLLRRLPAVLAASPLTVEVYSALRAQIAPLLGHAGGDALNVATEFTAQPHASFSQAARCSGVPCAPAGDNPNHIAMPASAAKLAFIRRCSIIGLLRILRFLFQLSDKRQLRTQQNRQLSGTVVVGQARQTETRVDRKLRDAVIRSLTGRFRPCRSASLAERLVPDSIIQLLLQRLLPAPRPLTSWALKFVARQWTN